jgi:hypothetical protein
MLFFFVLPPGVEFDFELLMVTCPVVLNHLRDTRHRTNPKHAHRERTAAGVERQLPCSACRCAPLIWFQLFDKMARQVRRAAIVTVRHARCGGKNDSRQFDQWCDGGKGSRVSTLDPRPSTLMRWGRCPRSSADRPRSSDPRSSILSGSR